MVLLHKSLELMGLVVVDDMQFEIVALLVQTLDDTQDTAEVLGFVAQGGDVKNPFPKALHVIPT